MQEQESSTTSTNHHSCYTSNLCEKLLTFGEKGQFSDICIISSDNVKFHLHKCVLSAASNYFMNMFSNNINKSPYTVVKIHKVNGKILKRILTFFYTGQIELENDTADILRAVSVFEIQALLMDCLNKLMTKKLDTKNFLDIVMIANQYGLGVLSEKVSKFAGLNFDQISKEEDFLKIDENLLSAIISREDLCVSSEENVYFSLVKWINHDKLNREQYAYELFSKVRYWLLSLDFIKEHRSKMPKQVECVELVCTWLEWYSSPRGLMHNYIRAGKEKFLIFFGYFKRFLKIVTILLCLMIVILEINFRRQKNLNLYKMQGQQSSSSSIFQSSNFASKLCEKLLASSEEGQFSDICLISSDDVRFNGHKCVLTAFSEYFKVMFGGALKEASSREVKIHEVNGKVLKPILTFLYTGQIELQSDTIEDILSAANFFQIQLLIQECYNFMGEKLDSKNCLGITMFADQHGLVELFQKASKFASARFETICNDQDFLKLDENQLSAIISSEELCVSSEEKVYFNLIKWLQHDRPNREKIAFKLFSKVRYWLLSLDFIKKHRSKLPNQVECLELVCTWLEWHSSPEGLRTIKSMEYSKPNKPHGLLLIGGGGIQTYDAELNIWTFESLSNLPYRFDKVVALKNKLIFSWLEKPLTCFNLQTKQVTNLPRMNIQRRSYGLAVLNDELYVIGGQKYLSPWKRVVEKYNYSTGKWQDVAPMNTIFSSPKVAVANGQLYVVGDRSPTMECLNPATNEWTSKPIAELPKSAFGFAEVGGNLYKIGGAQYSETRYGKDTYFKSVQSFDPFSSTWTQKGQMKIALADPHCISWNNRLITCGGRDETGTSLNLVQEYNPNTNEWRSLAQLIEYMPSNEYGLVAFN
ncbi:kelch-like protein 3 [Episyrphus balteatus]|uniref:kelch-like protein 3 n=1 Tax=Episyrphus balteatus TaxID=286459 RepID=UPI0024868222|nr:kelch-like protein 3 [Episyrphus balteatus]